MNLYLYIVQTIQVSNIYLWYYYAFWLIYFTIYAQPRFIYGNEFFTGNDNWIRNLNITRKQGSLDTIETRVLRIGNSYKHKQTSVATPARISVYAQTVSSLARINHSQQAPLSQITTIWARFNSIYCPFNRKHTFMPIYVGIIYIPHKCVWWYITYIYIYKQWLQQ